MLSGNDFMIWQATDGRMARSLQARRRGRLPWASGSRGTQLPTMTTARMDPAAQMQNTRYCLYRTKLPGGVDPAQLCLMMQ